MKKISVISSLLVAGSLTFTSLTANAGEHEEIEPIAEDYQERGEGLNHTALQYLANVDPESLDEAPVYEGKYDFTNQDENYIYHFYSDGENWDWSKKPVKSDDVNYEDTIVENSGDSIEDVKLMHRANVDPESLDEKPVKKGAYDISAQDENYAYHFYSDGQFWTWSKTPLNSQSYETTIEEDNSKEGLTHQKLMYIANVDPDKLNEKPVYEGEYGFTIQDENYVYHFASDGEYWTWTKTPLEKDNK